MKFFNDIDVNQIAKQIEDAPIDQKSQVIVQSIQKMLDTAMGDQVAEYQEMAAEVASNRQAAEKFGLRQLSKEEVDFYQKVTTGALPADQDDLMPTTITNYIFEDLKQARPLFKHIDWTPAGVKKWIVGERVGKSTWGAIDAKVTEEIKATLDTIDLEAHKLSAFSIIPLGIIDLGLPWVDKFVRENLLEANEEGLEEGFVAGNGKDAPIGLLKDIDGSVTGGVYSDATAKPITSFSPEGLKDALVSLIDDGKRKLGKLVMVVNPTDLITKISPATMFLTATGEYRKVVPYDIDFVEAASVPTGKAVLFVSKGYSAGISRMGLYATTEYNFLDHVKTYKAVTYGNGRLKKQNMAVVLDITNLEPHAFNVKGLTEGEGA